MTTLPNLHQTFLDRLLPLVAADPRFEAVLGAGSMISHQAGQGGFDDLSDIDLVMVVKADAYATVMESRREFAATAGDLLSAFTGEHVGEPRLLICLYGPDLLHVDFKFVRAEDLSDRVETPVILWARDETAMRATLDAARAGWPNRDPQWFEDRAWVWLHYGATKLKRGELWEALAMLAFFREQVLGNMLHRRAGRDQRGLRRIESAGGDILTPTHAMPDAHDIAAALKASATLYLALRDDAPPPRLTPLMPQAMWPWLEIAA